MSSHFDDEEREKQERRARRAFEAARDQQVHDRLHVSEAAREHIEAIQAAGRATRAAMREEQAMNWEQDVIDEKARLRQEKPAPEHAPDASFWRGAKTQRESEEKLTARAERNVMQDNERALARTYAIEVSLINVAVLEDLREFDRTTDTKETEQPQAELQREQGTSGETPEHKSAPEPEPAREAFGRAMSRDDGGREL